MSRVYSTTLVLVLGVVCVSAEISGWKPILPPGVSSYDSRHSQSPPLTARDSIYHGPVDTPYHQYQNEDSDQCTIYKVAFNQELYFQYVQYKLGMPDIKEFTLCMWTKFTNHSNDHPLFSYAVGNQPRGILVWVSNTNRASYFSMAVEGHTFYRLNYPLRLNRWYHSCSSWNSNTGEWQLWVNAERVGRGFHNRLVGYVIPGGGIAITGQEQRQNGGGFQEGPHAPAGSGGMLGEVTMVHLYAAALAPGKAHKDHKHHHGQHNHVPVTAAPPPPPTTPAPPQGFLVGNQLPSTLNLNLGNLHLQRPLLPVGVTPSPTFNPLGLLAARAPFPPGPQIFASGLGLSLGQRLFKREDGTVVEGENKKVNKRETEVSTDKEEKTITKRSTKETTDDNDDKSIKKRNTDASTSTEDKNHKKRGVFFGQDFSSGLSTGLGQNLDLLIDNQANTIQPSSGQQMAKDEAYPREPAEGEVIQVMNVCSGCAEEPFKNAEIISWRNTPKKLYSGALFVPATPQCRKF